MKDIVLAIDDTASRYKNLAKAIKDKNLILACVQNPDAAEMLLNTKRVLCVFLDHDMDGWEGTFYARRILPARGVPVIISSGNLYGAKRIEEILSENFVEHKTVSVSAPDADERWIQLVLDCTKEVPSCW